jgi:CopG family nickel-responsive transcriptional regulator
MHRVTISLEEGLAREFDRHLRARGYQNRSEAVRDLVRQAVGEQRATSAPDAACIGNLSYVYNHNVRSLAQRLIAMQLDQHDLIVAATHVPLDHDHCIQTLLLKGSVRKVQTFADELRAERGVRFGSLNLIAVERHDHHGASRPHRHEGHAHLSPLPG